MGLIQREIEKAGIATVGVSIVRDYSEKVRPPRTVFVRWPFGHPLGEPGNAPQQRAVICEAFKALYALEEPGQIVDLPFAWRRFDYAKYQEPESFPPT
ncbi:reductase [Desulfuromonas versatilis]|uniref:Reductase n=1 Tax=Desulfuromonas versatilis TaxID=2802975 RepID=A0ABN6DSR1_9BACT|nr:hypothetical protein [Desulfuromonas versatilis]BCR03218.1 reductase [Desulfuromonas versatilis]